MADTSLIFNLLGNPTGALAAARAVGSGMSAVAQGTEEAMSRASGSLDRATGKWKGKLQTAGLAVGAVAGAAIMTSLAGAIEQGNAQLKLQAQLGVDKATAAGIGKAAGRAYASGFGASVVENMSTARLAVQAGLAEATDTAGVQRAVQAAETLATAYEVDVSAGARAAGNMLKTGMAKSAEEAYDIIYAGLRGTGDLAGDLLDTWTEYSIKFQDLGLNGATSMGLLQQGAKAGARDLDKVADAMKEFAIRAVDGSKTTSTGFTMIGLSSSTMAAQIGKGGTSAAAALDLTLDRLRAMKDPVAQSQAAVALFGAKAEDLGQALYALDPSSAVAALGQVDGAVKAAGDTLQESGTARAQKFKAAMQTGLTNAMSAALPYANSLANAMTKHGDALQKAMPWIVGVGAAIGVTAAATKAWAAVQGVMTAAEAVGTAVTWAFGLSLWSLPITWIVAGILLLIGVIVLIAVKTTWFQTAWKATWGGIKAAASAVANWFTGPFVGFFVGVWDRIKAAWSGAVTWVGDLPGRIGAALQALPTMLWKLITSAFTQAAFAAGYVLGQIVQAVIRFPAQAVAALMALPGLISGVFTWAWNTAMSITSSVANWIVGFVFGLPDRIVGALMSLRGMVMGVMSSAWSAASSAVSSGIGWVMNHVHLLPIQIWNTLSVIPDRLFGLGGSIISGLINGIHNAAGRLSSLARDMARNFLDGFKRSMGIGSPSKVMHDLATSGIVAGLVGGMQSGAGRVAAAGEGLYGPLTSGAGGRTTGGRLLAGSGPAQRIIIEIKSSGNRASDLLVEMIRDAIGVVGGDGAVSVVRR
jgi:phage-related minor tail protein